MSYPLYLDLRGHETVLSGLYPTGQGDGFSVTTGQEAAEAAQAVAPASQAPPARNVGA